MRFSAGRLVIPFVLAVALVAPAVAQDKPQDGRVIRGPEVGAPVTPFLWEGDLRDLPKPPVWRPGDPVKEIPRRFYPRPGSAPRPSYETRRDPLLERQRSVPLDTSRAFTTPTRNFPGIDYTGVNPPDTVGDVGPNHYVQMVNDSIGAVVRIWDKTEPLPAELASFTLDTLGSGLCSDGFGDPIVLYDRFADRWMLSEFSDSGNNLCVYVSQTSDPVSGGWFAYGFTAPSFPDYPKYGVWPTDANAGAGSYVVTANDGGPGIYALDRGAMLTGAAATFQRLTIPDLPGFSFEAPAPADVDGATAPPALAPAIIMRHRDTENHSGPAAPGDLLEMWLFDVDWATPANTTLTAQPAIDVAEFDSDLCGLTSFFCFPQPDSSTTLDPLREVIMNRLQYINFGDYETLVGNLVTDIDGNDLGGLRWFELRRTGGGGWTLHQEGTWSPDADHRWMAAGAMDQSGNIAIAYSVSSSTTYPSLRFTGRKADDPLGAMTQPETSIHEGSSPNSSNRWGDYAAMNLDPVDDCTFWFTSLDNVTNNWRTQIASFKFDACGCELEPLPLGVTAQVTGDNEIEVGWNDSELATVVEYTVRRSFTPGGPYETVAIVADGSPGIGSGPGYFFTDTDVSAGSTYYYIVRATDGIACQSDPSNEAGATATGLCTLPPVFDGLQSVTTPFFATCTLDLSWNAATANCGGPIRYDVYRSTTPGFVPDLSSLLVSDVIGTTLTDVEQLQNGTPYYYVVRAVDTAIATEESNLVEQVGVSEGNLTTGTWVDDAGDSGTAKMILEAPWSIDPTEGNVGPAVYKTGNYGDLTCAGLRTPELRLGVGSMLSFSSRYDIENSWDKGEVQISTDGGNSWQRVELDAGYPGTSSNASDNCGLPTGSYFTGVDNTWADHTADLSGWSGLDVQIRFVISSDGSVTNSGWWIDDVGITQVDVPGVCAPGSGCEDNPFVDVTPDGPLAVCVLDDVPLTADVSGGVGPFDFQWLRDGVEILDENLDTYTASDTGTHTYNVRAQAQSCPDAVSDGLSTQITWIDAPTFDGVKTVTDPQSTTCTLDLTWDPAVSICPGPVTYAIYRDTTSPVGLTPANLVASGIAGTSFSDTTVLVSGADYHYVVRAIEGSTAVFDDNLIEASASPTGPGGGPVVVLAEDFEAGIPAGWSIIDGQSAGNTWYADDATDPAGCSNTDPNPPLAGTWAGVDSDCPGSGFPFDEELITPVLDLSGSSSVTLEFDHWFRWYSGGGDEKADVDVRSSLTGGQWVNVQRWTGASTNNADTAVLDITPEAAGASDVEIRWHYYDADFDWTWFVDNVTVTGIVVSDCATGGGTGAPPPAPDGSVATTPLRASRGSIGGDPIDVTWDVTSCTATDYNLVYGDLADVGTWIVAGAECSIGTSGTHGWSGAPAGDLYFVIVGTDDVATESSWGLASGPVERNGALASGRCGVTSKNTTTTCP